MTETPDSIGLDFDGVVIDREAEVPIGVQLAWALRSRIGGGAFKPGQRLPGLRDAAEALGVNVNTVRAVYQRLEREGLIDSQQGSGTFVASAPRRPSDAVTIAASTAEESREAGVDPREVAAAVYVSAAAPSQPLDPAVGRRRALRKQIAVLERAIGEIESDYPGVAPATRMDTGVGPRLLSADQLHQVRTQLIRRLASIQSAIDEQTRAGQEAASQAHDRRPAKRETAAKQPKRATRPRTGPRPATAET
jgi:GntR family transcriptional regulator